MGGSSALPPVSAARPVSAVNLLPQGRGVPTITATPCPRRIQPTSRSPAEPGREGQQPGERAARADRACCSLPGPEGLRAAVDQYTALMHQQRLLDYTMIMSEAVAELDMLADAVCELLEMPSEKGE